MDLDQLPLNMFEVDCDGSACASGDVSRHIHPPQLTYWHREAIARVRVVDNKRVEYSKAEGIQRLVIIPEES